MRPWSAVLALAAGAAGSCSLAAQAPALGPVQDLAAQHCADCHDADAHKGGLDLWARAAGDPLTWLATLSRVRDRLRAGEMPPADAEPLPAAARARLIGFCDATLAERVPALPVAPGRVTVRRLSRGEWTNTVRDLFGVETPLAGAFPTDDLGYGFDNIGAALSFSTLHLEKYLAAARDVAAQVFPGADAGAPAVRRWQAERMRLVAGPGADQDGDVAVLYTNATIAATVDLPRDGDYRLRILAGADQAGDEPAKMQVDADGRRLELFLVPVVDPRPLQLTARLQQGRRRIALSFVNDYYAPHDPDPARRDRNLRIDWLEVEGPLDARPLPPQRAWLAAADLPQAPPASRLRALVRAILPRAWRRPSSDQDVLRAAGPGIEALTAGEPFHVAMQRVLQAVLTSPQFLFRLEPDGGAARGNVVRPVPGPALAVRLSYFLWSSAPDDLLRELGASGRLTAPDVLDAQVQRLLADPRAEALATDFAAQWLELRELAERTPDPARFPGFDDALRRSLRRESELLFLAVLRDGLDVRTLLDCDFTYADRTLAAFYGLPGRFDDAFVRVPLPGPLRVRGGILGQGSMLAVTSNPTRTSPVKRGKWILENVLGQAPPPPPPGNGSLPDEAAAKTPAGLREQMALHRGKAECAVCHVRMDALGLALERFDAIGRLRARDEQGAPIDDTGELPDGRRLLGLAGLEAALRDDPAFERTLARKLFVYAVGRDLGDIDRLKLDLAVDRLRAQGEVTIAGLVLAVVHQDAFRLRLAGG